MYLYCPYQPEFPDLVLIFFFSFSLSCSVSPQHTNILHLLALNMVHVISPCDKHGDNKGDSGIPSSNSVDRGGNFIFARLCQPWPTRDGRLGWARARARV